MPSIIGFLLTKHRNRTSDNIHRNKHDYIFGEFRRCTHFNTQLQHQPEVVIIMTPSGFGITRCSGNSERIALDTMCSCLCDEIFCIMFRPAVGGFHIIFPCNFTVFIRRSTSPIFINHQWRNKVNFLSFSGCSNPNDFTGCFYIFFFQLVIGVQEIYMCTIVINHIDLIANQVIILAAQSELIFR